MKITKLICGGLIWLSLALVSANSYASEREIAVIVNVGNPLEQLSLRQVKQIFLGRLRSFPGVDKVVEVADREDTSKLYRNFYAKIIRMNPSNLKRYRARYLFSGQGLLPRTINSHRNMIAFVSSDASAIGYAELEKGKEAPNGVKVLYRFDIDNAD